METIIRPASLADKDVILDFIKTAYANDGDVIRQKMLKRWSWQYRENPSIDQQKDDLTILLATKKDQIVGQACMTPVKLKVKDEYHTASWGTDFIVMPDCRGEGLGKKLMQIEIEHCDFMIGLRMHPVTRKIAEKLGYKNLGPALFYRRIVRHDSFLFYQYLMKATKSMPVINQIAKTLWNRFWLDKLVAITMNIILGLRDLFDRQTKKENQSDIQEILSFDERIDHLWNLTNHQYDIIVRRDKEFLNWRYSPKTTLKYRKFIAVKNDEIKGYIVLRREEPGERNFGIIVDLYASRDDPNTIEELLRHAIKFFGKDVAVIECKFSVKEYHKALSKLGFLRMERLVPIFHCQNSSVADTLLAFKDNCFFTKGDHDMDQFSLFRTVQ